MSEQEIPADIKQAATVFADRYLGFNISCQRLYADIAAALLAERQKATEAERERCANIAQVYALMTAEVDGTWLIFSPKDPRETGSQIAEAIRNNSNPHQAPVSSGAPVTADPVVTPPTAGSADPFTDTGPQVFSDQEPTA